MISYYLHLILFPLSLLPILNFAFRFNLILINHTLKTVCDVNNKVIISRY